jgi:hypothetical protein
LVASASFVAVGLAGLASMAVSAGGNQETDGVTPKGLSYVCGTIQGSRLAQPISRRSFSARHPYFNKS